MFCGLKDEDLIRVIKRGRIRSIRLNPAGFSLSLKLELEGPARALFKPSQHELRSVPRKEIVAYRINRLLGLSRVPPATTRVITLRQFYRKAGFAKRIRNFVVSRSRITDRSLRGEVSWWIPKIMHLDLEKPLWQARWESWLRHDTLLGPREWELAGQLSRLIVFDALVNNQDRFTGNNFLATPDGKHLYIMDNAVSLFTDKTNRGPGLVALYRVHRFSRMLYRALKRLTAESIKKALKAEDNVAWSFLIRKVELEALMARRDFILNRAHELVIKHGWDRVMYFP